MKRKILSGIMLGAVVGLLILFAMPSYKYGEASPAGSMAKPFSFELNGSPEQLSDLRGKVVVLNFWATWCPPCVEETPSLVALQREIGPKGGVVLGISVDSDAQVYAQFLQTNGIDYPTYRDPDSKIPSEYGTLVYPETYIIDQRGKIARKLVGAQDWMSPEMTAYLKSLLGKN
ncbi:MAG TPA: TlpA disulfide reductase family protein [Candidatus Acidoferrales bacterium]|nr:TlpA disulfide reductase family protein [Candidatus Acidoferrales bacterium]